MQNVKSIETANKQTLTMEEMDNVGGGFLMDLIGGAASLFVGALYGVAQTFQVGFFGLPEYEAY